MPDTTGPCASCLHSHYCLGCLWLWHKVLLTEQGKQPLCVSLSINLFFLTKKGFFFHLWRTKICSFHQNQHHPKRSALFYITSTAANVFTVSRVGGIIFLPLEEDTCFRSFSTEWKHFHIKTEDRFCFSMPILVFWYFPLCCCVLVEMSWNGIPHKEMILKKCFLTFTCFYLGHCFFSFQARVNFISFIFLTN